MKKHPSTRAVHGGEEQPHALNAIAPPIFQTAIYAMESFDALRRHAAGEPSYLYSRGGNPTVELAARKVAELEGAAAAVVTASGTAATLLIVLAFLESGDELIATESVYGGTSRMFAELLPRLGMGARMLEHDDLDQVPRLVNERTRILWFDSPSNPLNRIVDLERAAGLARQYGLLSVIDGTFASPINQRPLEYGIDLVMHSATKYLGGHSDLLAGAVAGRRELIARLEYVLTGTGAILDPGAAALLIRGMKTLDLRVERANRNALRLAEFLQGREEIARVYYAGLPSNPFHELARRQMSGFGGVVSADLAGGEAALERFCDALRLIKISTSLGGTETVVTAPVYTSHHGFSEEQLARLGISHATARFSVGIEAIEDLIEDVARALNAARRASAI